MNLTKVILRSYRSFNYDYDGKCGTDESEFPNCKSFWETEADYESWKPWVQVPLQAPITCVVGNNESGKTLLLEAISKCMLCNPFVLEDICRYSSECQLSNLGLPQLGIFWDGSPAEIATVSQLVIQPDDEESEAPHEESAAESAPQFTSLAILRHGEEYRLVLIGADGTTTKEAAIQPDQFEQFKSTLPAVFRVKSNIVLPASVTMQSLFKIALHGQPDDVINKVVEEFKELFADRNEFNNTRVNDADRLVFRLLQASSNIDLEMLKNLAHASEPLLKQFSHQASELVEELLNLSYWWGQDVDLRLNIDFRNERIILNVSDRTESWYGFAERSDGMRYFLAYLIQIILQLREVNRPLLILSDEPDFALSAVGQRDLLKFYERIVSGKHGYPKCQLVYTTHSAELIDPNYPGRITVLKKGRFDDGTTVVGRAHHRLFEPVRSALGGRVCSIPFIDGPNLVVEGSSDRAFVIRMSQYLAKHGEPHLNLAYLSIVDAQGTSNIGKIVAAAKHVGGDRAFITLLVDNDEPGRAAATEAKDMDDYLKQENQVVSIDDVLGPGLGKDAELEDLVPCSLYLNALKRVLDTRGLGHVSSHLPSEADLETQAVSKPIVDVLEPIIKAHSPNPDFAALPKEEVLEDVFDLLDTLESDDSNVVDFKKHLLALSGILMDRVDNNLRRKRHDEIQRKLRYSIREFFNSYRVEVSKARAAEFLGELRSLGMKIAPVGGFDREVDSLVQKHHLREGVTSEPVADNERFRQEVIQLPQRLTIDRSRSMS